MAYNYPYLYSPFRRYTNYNYKYPNYYKQPYNTNFKKEIKQETNESKNSSLNKPFFKDELKNNIEREEDSREFFEIFGIKLFFDDILLICLIFFLYNEGVKDQYLFISLILLLLS